MELGLEGRAALVTGASSGIGKGIAAGLVAEGASVAISSSSAERIEAAAGEIGARGYVHDSRDLDATAFTREQWRAAYESLMLAPMGLIERVLPGMRERGFGRIVSVSSTAVVEPAPNLMLSNTHRAGLVAGFKTLARQVARDGVTLNTVMPGRIDTARLAELMGSAEAAREHASEWVPAGRLGTVDEFAAVAVFLCSDRAAYVTGTSIRVDGGYTQSV